MKRLLYLFFFVLIMAACRQNPVKDEAGLQYFGEKITTEASLDFDQFIEQAEDQDSLLNIKLKAKVSEVCQAKGCWMNLVSDQGSSDQSLFVQFKDYGFFMPKDIAGRDVIIEGIAHKSITSVDDLRHFAEDKGLPEDEIAAIVEPKEEWKFLASGVILLP